MDSDSPNGYCYPPFQQLGPGARKTCQQHGAMTVILRKEHCAEEGTVDTRHDMILDIHKQLLVKTKCLSSAGCSESARSP